VLHAARGRPRAQCQPNENLRTDGGRPARLHPDRPIAPHPGRGIAAVHRSAGAGGSGGMSTKRRGHGEGSIYQLPDGRFRGVVDLGWVNGKRRRKYVTRRTRSEVAKALRELATLAESGRLSTRRVPTLAQWMEIY